MPVPLRSIQIPFERDIYAAWDAGAQNVMGVAATGFGKTVVLSKLLYDEPGASIAVAHRQELVSQISIALARNGVRHRLVGNNSSLMRVITALQVAEVGYSYLDPTAKTGVGGVDTIVKMPDEPWFRQIRLAIQDEGHHVLKENKWGKAQTKFPNARGLFPTATPRRADGRGLGRHHDGLADAMVCAPTMREIINLGYLTDYRLICPPIPSDFDLTNVGVSETTGDFTPPGLRKARRASATLTGDVVKHYKRFADGMMGVTFEVDVESATKTAAAFRAAGVKAEVVSANTPDSLRHDIIRRFKRGEILQLVNVDLFGEGFDLPAIQVVSFARPTHSFALYSQQFGRVLRLLLGSEYLRIWDSFSVSERLALIAGSMKPKGIVIDHVGNVVRHNGPPDKHQVWSLDRRVKRKGKSDEIPLTVCIECFSPYERSFRCCPYCGFEMSLTATQRSNPEFVDGDLLELDHETLQKLRGELKRKDGDFYAPTGLPIPAQIAARSKWMERQANQRSLRNAVAWWAGIEHAQGYSQSESFRRFFFKFGTDVANAQLLGASEAEELAVKVMIECGKFGIDTSVNAELYFSSQSL